MAKRTSPTASAKAQTKVGRLGQYTIAVLVPCYNEEAAIAKVPR